MGLLFYKESFHLNSVNSDVDKDPAHLICSLIYVVWCPSLAYEHSLVNMKEKCVTLYKVTFLFRKIRN